MTTLKSETPHLRPRRRRLAHRTFVLLVGSLVLWISVAYVVLPQWWQHRERWHPALVDAPRITVTANAIPGDPLNVLVIGSERHLIAAMLSAGWSPADPITLESSVRMVESSIFHRPYEDAPVSNLYLFGRKEDLAFEKPLGSDPRQRHHVRFWRDDEQDTAGRMAWWGAVTYDRSVGLSHTTGQVTHHISPEVDGERDGLGEDLEKAGKVVGQRLQEGFQATQGRNGGGDPWVSDGQLRVVDLVE